MSAESKSAFDVEALRAQFPILHHPVRGKRLAYLDNAATTQKPQSVIDAITHYYTHDNANVHRGLHALAERATLSYEAARDKLAALLNAPSRESVVWTKGTSDSVNLVAQAFALSELGPGKAVLISELEHHSNLVPWQLACERSGGELRWLPLKEDGSLDLTELDTKLDGVAIVALGHVSNSLGTVHPVETIIERAHAAGAAVLLDGAQAMAHMAVDVQALDVDFYALSAHKMFGPTGVGALIGKPEWLDRLPPVAGGGEMIETVEMQGSTWNALPYKFEPGTPNIAGVIGFGAACEFVAGLNRDAVAAHEHALLISATELLSAIPGVTMIGTAPGKAAICSFVMDTAHPQDIGTIVDQAGVAVRTGHHCTMPAMSRFGVPGTVRASFAAYNNQDDLDQLAGALASVQRLFSN